MRTFLDSLSQRLAAAFVRPEKRHPGRSYPCRCGRPVFFHNCLCLACQAQLGYVPATARVHALEAAAQAGLWRLHDGAGEHRRCTNFDLAAGCNWLIPADDPQPLCRACRLNRTIPNLGDPEHGREDGELWQRLEAAKRRLVASLLALGLPVQSRETEDPGHGLAFDFLRSPKEGPRVLTGHADGLITINVEEADDAVREKIRVGLREPYRTLLGHFRHEVGHYYWDRLVAGTPWLEPFREVFGDERADYAAALKRNYEQGPAPDWSQRHVSAYASVHPWEDWAETWAHYLHIVDSLQTALNFGFGGDTVEFSIEPFGRDALYQPDHPGATRFLELLNSWIELVAVLNELNRSLGKPDPYPFVLSKPAVRKLHFIHLLVMENRAAGADRG
ncbi:MAG TPA: putative zinc-binding metallopeptidase [Verrucomicrobiota bacterium]|nr:putative zinc-binding metallopeptidase [Verrucomicrobiota bacterium]